MFSRWVTTAPETLGNVFNSPGGEGQLRLHDVRLQRYPELGGGCAEPWDTTPWAVGTVAGLSPGSVIPGNSVVTFNVNLDLPGVRELLSAVARRLAKWACS